MRWVAIGRSISWVGTLLLLVGPLGTRLGVWPFPLGLALFALSALVALAGLVATLVGGAKTRAWRPALAAALVALLVLALPAWQLSRAGGAPPIHDITTDADDPPSFVSLVPLRQGAPNPPAYDGAEVASQQREAYPDIGPMTVAAAPAEAFARSLDVARGLGWEIVASVPDEGRIEAVDTTFWFGFKDDIVVRLRPAGIGTRIDVRSKSRVGLGDAGANARRVRAFLAAMQ
jgi:uncharacterized protein (DUF1499 family)